MRKQKLDEALPWLERAAREAPENARYAYVYGIALNSSGQTNKALDVLSAAQAHHPADRDLLYALVSINRDAGRVADAQHYMDLLTALEPDESLPTGTAHD